MSDDSDLLQIDAIEIGIVLFKMNTLLDHIICSITKQDFTDLAIYYSNGNSKHVITVNLLPNDNWFKRMSYDEFISKPMKNLAVKKLRNNVKEFILSLIKTLKIMSHSDTAGFLTYLLGGDVYTDIPCCGVHMLNMIVKDMQCDYMFGDNRTISAKTVEELNRGMSNCEYYKSNIIYHLLASITQLPNTHQLQRYIVKDGLFEDIKYLDYQTSTMIENYDDCELLLAVFVDKLQDMNFYNLVCNVVDTSRQENGKIIEKLLKTLYDTTVTSSRCVQDLLNEMNTSNERINSIINRFTQECNTVSRITNKKICQLITPNKQLKNKVDSNTFAKLYSDFYNLITTIRKDGTAELNINELIDKLNRLRDEYGITHPQITHLSDKYSYTIIAKTKPEQQIVVKLSKGKEVILTNKGAMLETLKREELLEILEVIDSSEVDTFDDLRAKIVQMLLT